ncbi:MAG TPA: hypothetical protein VMJ93_15695 [Verrucomicrobiae bacterium]|nr:hypothetical protein [Verrucomicrobiae bacterium]
MNYERMDEEECEATGWKENRGLERYETEAGEGSGDRLLGAMQGFAKRAVGVAGGFGIEMAVGNRGR